MKRLLPATGITFISLFVLSQSRKRFFTSVIGVASLFCFCSLLTTPKVSYSQDRLYGLTTNGGPGGKGNAFSMQTSGADFKVLKAFTSLGANPMESLVRGSDGFFYGTMRRGGKYNLGSIFKMNAAGVITVLKHLNGPDGILPEGSLIEAQDKNFYGMTYAGGTRNFGTVFRITPTGTYTVIHHFQGGLVDRQYGKHPKGSLVLKQGYLFGMTSQSYFPNYAATYGVIFRMSLSGAYQQLWLCQGNSTRHPVSDLTERSDGLLYGMSPDGGGGQSVPHYGTMFRTAFEDFRGVFFSFSLHNPSLGRKPQGGFVNIGDGYLYGMTTEGGTDGAGTIIRMGKPSEDQSGVPTFKLLKNLQFSTTGGNPTGKLCNGGDGYLYGLTTIGGNYGQGTIFKMSITTFAITVIRHLNAIKDGGKAYGSLIRNSDGYFYGMASEGGHQLSSPNITTGSGTIFKINSAGSFAIVAQLPDATLGMVPRESLSLGRDGNYYGTTEEGGTYGVGTIFKISSTGVFTKMRSLTPNVNGANPKDGPIHASDGNLYGTTSKGGAYGHGTIYKITTAGVISTFYSFNGNLGSNPHGKLMQASDGYLYGVTRNGGSNNQGTIFRISLTGTYAVLRHLLASTDGGEPEGNLYQASAGGTIWGTATIGGVNGAGTIFKLTGTVFSVVKNMSTSLGRIPSGNLFLASNGVYYGTTNAGGTYGYGTIFRVTGSTGYTYVVHHFQGGVSGGRPYGGLVEDGNKVLYGTASVGGSYGGGVIFKFTFGTNTYSIIKHLEPGITGTVPKGNLILKKATTASSASLLDPADMAIIGQARMLYPNPARDHVILQSEELQSEFSIQLINLSGQVVRSIVNPKMISKTSVQVDVSAFPPGSYMLMLHTRSGSSAFKFIKQ